MTYPGNPELSEEIRQRILNTFHQTLDLAGQGSRQEALLGCDFILRLDPLFEPARTLQDRLQGAEGAVSIDDLKLEVPTGDATTQTPPAEGAAPPADETPKESGIGDIGELEDLDLDLGTDPEQPAAAAQPDLADELRRLLDLRQFQHIQELAQQHQDRITADPELQGILHTALERHEAEPYVQSFLESCAQAQAAGNLDEARGILAKASELDASHPGIRELELKLAPTGEAPPPTEAPAPAEPEPIDDLAALQPELSAEVPDLSLTAQPAASLDSESEQRIGDLLAEGQQAFEQAEYQAAIDAWSRIFLIDIDHAEANRRIELARKLKAEVERKVEEAFHEGVSDLESSAIAEAGVAFRRVLEMQPNHLAAQEYLDKIESGEFSKAKQAARAPAAEAPGEPRPAAAPPGEADEQALPDLADELDAEVFEPEADLDGEVAAAPDLLPEEWERPARPKRTLWVIAASVLILVLAGGWFLLSKWDRIFPNSAVEPPEAGTSRPDPIARANELHGEGKTPMAIAQLRRLPPDHPQHSEAQALIAQWESSETSTGSQAVGPSPDELARQAALIAAAMQAADQRDNLGAAELLERAAEIAALEPETAALQAAAREELRLIEDELQLFEQGDWEYALPNLWRLHEAQPANRDVQRLMVDSYYNLGLRDLQRGDPISAIDKLKEATDLAPDDPDVARLATFAETYKTRPSDLLYRIFVKYQPFR